MDVEVADNPDKARFEIVADGELAGFVQYHLRGQEIAFTHTQTDDRFRGHGLGSQLVRTALDAARALATEPAPAAGDPESAAGRRAALLAIAGDGAR